MCIPIAVDAHISRDTYPVDAPGLARFEVRAILLVFVC